VNGKDLFDEWTELEHEDILELGYAYAFSVQLKEPEATTCRGSILRSRGTVFAQNMSEVPRMASMLFKDKESKDRKEGTFEIMDLLGTTLGRERLSDKYECEIAQECYRALEKRSQQHCTNGDEGSLLHAFLANARRAVKLIEEANAITAELKQSSGLFFDLATTTPTFGYGYGKPHVPEFCVRVMASAQAKAVRTVVRTNGVRDKLFHATKSIEQAGFGDEHADPRVVYIWTFRKFEARLELMRAAYIAWHDDPDDVPDQLFDPWVEQSPTELQELQSKHAHEMQAALDDQRGSSEEVNRLEAANVALMCEVKGLRTALERLAPPETSDAIVDAQEPQDPGFRSPLVGKKSSSQSNRIAQVRSSDAARRPDAYSRRSATWSPRVSVQAEARDSPRHRPHHAEQRASKIEQLAGWQRAAADEVDKLRASMQQSEESFCRERQKAAEWQQGVVTKLSEMGDQIDRLEEAKERYKVELQAKSRTIDYVTRQLTQVYAAHKSAQDAVGSRSHEGTLKAPVGGGTAILNPFKKNFGSLQWPSHVGSQEMHSPVVAADGAEHRCEDVAKSPVLHTVNMRPATPWTPKASPRVAIRPPVVLKTTTEAIVDPGAFTLRSDEAR